MECLAFCFIVAMVVFFVVVIGGVGSIGVSTAKSAIDLKPEDFEIEPSKKQLETTTPLGEEYIPDFVDGTPRKITPEEQVRQFILQLLISQGFKKSQIAVEFPIAAGSSTKFIDIAIFQVDTPHLAENVWAVVECKRRAITNPKEGVAQMKSYMAVCLNCQWGMWTNGQSKAVYTKVSRAGRLQWEQRGELPLPGTDV